jgi:hypothetical protein
MSHKYTDQDIKAVISYIIEEVDGDKPYSKTVDLAFENMINRMILEDNFEKWYNGIAFSSIKDRVETTLLKEAFLSGAKSILISLVDEEDKENTVYSEMSPKDLFRIVQRLLKIGDERMISDLSKSFTESSADDKARIKAMPNNIISEDFDKMKPYKHVTLEDMLNITDESYPAYPHK